MQIFINYKRRVDPDHEIARQLEEVLKQAGHVVFRDESSIHGGKKWAEVIEKGIRDSSVVLSLVSNAALSSDWVLNEIDFAQRHGKLLLPIVLEKLEESLEFQEFIPRFLRIQYLLYSGDTERLAVEVLQGLDEGVEGLASRNSRHRVLVLDELDDSANPAWESFAANHPECHDDMRVRLGLEDVVRLAMLRSPYYRRSLDTKHDPTDQPTPKADPLALSAYRQCIYSRVATGEFGVTGFARADVIAHKPGVSVDQELRGFLGLMVRLSNVRRVRSTLATLEELHRVEQIRYDVGMTPMQAVEAIKVRIYEMHDELARVEDPWEEALEHFQTYVLGLPARFQFEPDDGLLSQIALIPPWAERANSQLSDWREKAVSENPYPETILAQLRLDIVQLIGQLEQHAQGMQAAWTCCPEREFDEVPEVETMAPIMPPGVEPLPPRLGVADQLSQLLGSLQTLARVIQLDPLTLGAPGPMVMNEQNSDWFRAPSDWDALTSEAKQPWKGGFMQAPTLLVDKIEELERLVGDAVSLFSRVRTAGLYAARVSLSLDRAEQIAADRRPDSELLKTNAVLRRRLRDSLRRTLTDLNRRARDVKNWRGAADSSLVASDAARAMLFYGRGRIDEVIVKSVELFNARHQLQRAWFRYQAARVQLHRDLGLQEIDDNGYCREVDAGLFI